MAASPPGGSLNSLNASPRTTAELTARSVFLTNPPAFDWEQQGQIAALAYCRSEGYTHAVETATIPFAHSGINPAMWDYTADLDDRPNYYTFAAYQTRQWTATCEKRVRRRR